MSGDHLAPQSMLSDLPVSSSPSQKIMSMDDGAEVDTSVELGRSNGIQRSDSVKRTTEASPWSSPTKYPVTSGRQLSSPRKQTSPVRHSPTKYTGHRPVVHETPNTASTHLLAPPAQSANRSVSGSSFCLPRSVLDMSMLGDCAPPSEMDQTMDFGCDEFGRASISPGLRGPRAPNFVSPIEPRQAESQEASQRRDAPIVTTLPRSHSNLSTSLSPSDPTAKVPAKTPSRPFPSSSSGSSMSSTGEDTARGIAGDISTVLPISAKKTRHLLRDEHLLKTETLMFDDDSIIHSRPNTLRNPLAKNARSPMPRMDEDVTMDIGALMAQMKGKSGGIEESFVDLLHGDPFDGLNQSILGGDESFLPASLRPAWGRNGTMPSPPKRPTPITPGTLRTLREVDTATLSRSARRRSRSLHEPRGQVDALATVRRRLESTSATPARQQDPTTPRVRLGMAPTASKRVSLSAGALPMPTNASHKKVELPARTPRNDPVSLSRTKSIERRARPPPGDGSPVLPLERIESKRGLSTPASLLTKRSLPPPEVKSDDTRAAPDASARARTYSRPRTGGESTTIPGSHKRTGSTPAAVVAPRNAVAPPTRTLTRPTSMLRPSSSTTSLANPARALPKSSSRPGLTSALPSTSSREFGRDASATTNRERVSRPPTASLASKRSIGSKLSTDPASIASPTKRSDPVALKSRAMSTPASAVVRSRPASSHISSRPTVGEAPKRSLAAPTTRVGPTASALPRPGATRAPSVKSSIGAGTGGLDDLRARLNKLSMRQQTSRPGK